MTEIKVKDLEAAADSVMDIFLKRYKEKDGDFFIAIPGGRSIVSFLNKLDGLDISLQRLHIFWVDERCVPIDDELSNYKQAWDTCLHELVNKYCLKNENIHPFKLWEHQDDKGAKVYQDLILSKCNKFDMIILGVGEDGHVASLFPNHQYPEGKCIFFVNNSPKAPSERISFSPELIKETECCVMLFLGNEKTQAYENFLDNSIKESQCPVKLFKNLKELYIIKNI